MSRPLSVSIPFYRFYFRFLRLHQAEITYQPDQVLTQIQAGLWAFVVPAGWAGWSVTSTR